MKQYLSFFVVLLLLTSCGSTKSTHKKPAANKTDRIVLQAQSFAGTPYKFGGITRKGMDCSGLVYIAFQREQIVLPRVSREMATKGKPLKRREVKKGDLVFFRTNKNSRRINHVGLVTKVKADEIFFIHASTSKGVITSSLTEKYWKDAFVQARRMI
ncbi:MAG: C40 family peptidase [Dokdonia sp.]|jgi:cell wall-associated NlpC family hydrolase